MCVNSDIFQAEHGYKTNILSFEHIRLYSMITLEDQEHCCVPVILVFIEER